MNYLRNKLIKLSEYCSLFYPRSFSQEGEDMLMKEIFLKQKKGFYVDIGAHHPKRFSNTYHFYKLGWRGINIDAMPGSMKFFKLFRNKDVNIESGVSDKEGEMTFYIFDEPAINTFSKEVAELNIGKYKLLKERKVKVLPLAKILDQYKPKNIDILSIDVEGMDLIVLQSNDWSKYKPRVILVESKAYKTVTSEDKIFDYLTIIGYSFYACTPRTTIFILHNL